MGVLGLSGLASGVDTDTLVTKLMQIERQGLSRISLNQARVQARQAGLKDISAKLSGLKDATAALRDATLWSNVQTVASTDSSKVGVERTADALPGNYSVSVQQLATPTEKTFNYTAPPTGNILNPGTNKTLTINGVDITLTPGMTAAQAASAINTAANGNATIGVFAAANASGQLILQSKATGAGPASDFTVSSTQTSEDTTKQKLGVDAMYTVDGVAHTSSTNVVSDGIPGLKLTLKAVTTANVGISATAPTLDKAAVKTKLKAFIEAYNGVVTLTRAKLTEDVDTKATTISAATKGQLAGDLQLTSMLTGMRRAVTDPMAGNAAALDEFAEMGISTGKSTGINPGPDSIQGKLVLDEGKLDALLAGDTNALKRLVGAEPGTPGIAQRLEAIVDNQIGTGKLFDGRLKSEDSELKRLGETLTRASGRIDQREKRLRAQFAAMESALQASQTQQSWLAGQIAKY
jgi:flagellar hook-associated protein 2